ncbi:hypothetical protein QZH41_002012 [Actinostola sp. cb2023]|nr:hypothetical protein QZH41_002012 [Actinostola sp. cb2023]
MEWSVLNLQWSGLLQTFNGVVCCRPAMEWSVLQTCNGGVCCRPSMEWSVADLQWSGLLQTFNGVVCCRPSMEWSAVDLQWSGLLQTFNGVVCFRPAMEWSVVDLQWSGLLQTFNGVVCFRPAMEWSVVDLQWSGLLQTFNGVVCFRPSMEWSVAELQWSGLLQTCNGICEDFIGLQMDPEEEDNMADGGHGFSSKNLGLRAQKKILGKMASKSIAKAFVDDTTGDLLDNLYRIAKLNGASKKEAEKLIKNLVKIVVKISILFRNDQFTREEITLAGKFRKSFRSAAMTFISFYEVDFSFDRQFLTKILEDCKVLLHQLVQNHLTAKSHGRIDHVFNYFGNGDLLERIFEPTGQFRGILKKMVDDLNKLMEDGSL